MGFEALGWNVGARLGSLPESVATGEHMPYTNVPSSSGRAWA
jgi:hypothetical protein